MIVDTSALLAILQDEPERHALADAIERAETRRISAANFGDCFAYALAMSLREPLLYKGEGFARTDVAPALAAPAA